MPERTPELIIDKDNRIVLRADVEFNLHDLVDAATTDQLFDLIVNLDAQVADWEFTERLHEHFAKAHEEYLKEVKPDAEEQVPG